jgi:hypothetical protein
MTQTPYTTTTEIYPNTHTPPSHYYKRFSKEFCTQMMKANKTTGEWEASNHKRKDKETENTIDSAAHNQTLKQKDN